MQVCIKTINNISLAEKRQMLNLHKQYFCNVQQKKFFRDLQEKNWCMLAVDDQNKIQGYSTFQLLTENIGKNEVMILYSGDTLMAKDYWQYNLTAIGFASVWQYLQKEYPHDDLYWLLLSKGYRTYRVLPVFFQQFYPRYNVTTPADMKQLIQKVCETKFNGCFDKERSIVLSKGKNDFLAPELAKIPSSKIKDPNVCYFLRQNPGYTRGDELACITSLHPSNIKRKQAEKVLSARNVLWLN
jgi:hypothetical protein